MRIRLRALGALTVAVLAAATHPVIGAAQDVAPLETWPPTLRDGQRAFERDLNAIPDLEQLSKYHVAMASIPHVAGTAGDRTVIQALEKALGDAGLAVETQPLWVYLSTFVSAEIDIVAPNPMPLPIREEALAEDPYSQNPKLMAGFNAYAASGEVTAGIVYANYGTKQDFDRLERMGVSVKGKIVLARYGRNYRGYKAKFAEAAGAVGLIIYTDPGDSGYKRGEVYPIGGFANKSQIQRGSIKTIPYPGDPLTPFKESTKDAKRVEPGTLALPEIPVQPVGWVAAEEILKRMTGKEAPEKWRGGLPLTYRITGGDALRVHMKVEQKREVVETANVFGTIEGERYPDEMIVIGCHHDAWGYGAGDPMAGMIVELEVARAFAKLAKDGRRPARTLVFAAWGAEEHGIVGSVEWVEAHAAKLAKQCVAYINLDMAALGPYLSAGASPTLRRVIADATREVKQIDTGRPKDRGTGEAGQTVFDTWSARREDPTFPGYPQMWDMGGGSDHIGFNCYLGVPCCGLAVRGAPGVSYHSIYDNLNWYRKVVGSYDSAQMLAKIVNVLTARLANAPLLPLDPTRIAPHLHMNLNRLDALARAADFGERQDRERMRSFVKRVDAFGEATAAVWKHVTTLAGTGKLSARDATSVNRLVMSLDRAWIDEKGLPGRPWFRNTLVSTDEDSGYASWVLPLLHHALKNRDIRKWRAALETYGGVLDTLEAAVRRMSDTVSAAK